MFQLAYIGPGVGIASSPWPSWETWALVAVLGVVLLLAAVAAWLALERSGRGPG